MKCDVCGKDGARQRYVSRSYGKGESLLVIEDVPTIHCPNCGEGYMTAQTLQVIERIKKLRQTVVSKRPVSVAVFK
ncbi:MAG: type II toxin-antitoxin system MqsA family antitoxin [Candidatus Poribacteria bacterium]|nr:type II toxin-antitoxin system MqsA family antitoxin [Candidatus Poribacteria bacterium]